MPDTMYSCGLVRTDTQMEAYWASSSFMIARELSASGSIRTVLTMCCPEFVLLTRERTLAGPFLAAPPVAPVDEGGSVVGDVGPL